jgi:HK97 gp10 family phage protein
MTIKIEVKGAKEVQQNLRVYNIQVKGASARGVAKASKFIIDTAKLIVPVDTGILKASITLLNFQPEVPTATVGTMVHYAPHVEYGTIKMRAQPYLRPVAMEGEQYLKEITALEIKSIKKL